MNGSQVFSGNLRAAYARLARALLLATSAAVVLSFAGGANAGVAVDAAYADKDAVRAAMAASLGYRAQAAMRESAGGVVTVVEYYHAGLEHYFITAEPAEIANLDGGAFGGVWKRTGQSFPAWDLTGRPADTVPVCRFFGTDQYRANGTRIGPNSHFYTADPAECAFVKTGYQSVAANGQSYPAWTYEADAFAVRLPVGGACPAGTTALYRAYNDGARGDPNHRYATSTATLMAMTGWTFEGLVMCLPAAAAAPFTVVGEIRGCDAANCAPPVSGGSGGGLVDVVVEIGNAGTTPVAVTVPAGFVFVSSSGTFQDGLLLDSLVVQVPASGSVRILLHLYCLNQDRASATSAAIYGAGAVTTDPGILAIVNLPRPFPVDAESIKTTVTQFAVWEVTNGKGPLSASQLDLLRNVYALADSDPMIAKAMTDFLDTLTVLSGGP